MKRTSKEETNRTRPGRYDTPPTREVPTGHVCIPRSQEDYRSLLPEVTYHILFEEGTERAFSHPFYVNHQRGLYRCAACGQPLFGSEAKYESGTGWPSFYAPVHKEALTYETDQKLFLPRTAIACSCCGGHIGHVFEDGPEPTGLRYCTNGTALSFEEEN